MRRFAAVAVIAVVSALALSACSLPPGIDGNLINDWAVGPAPVQSAPVVGACYSSDDADMLDNKKVDCADPHAVEVAYMGTFTGSNASRQTPPPTGSALLKSTYASCQTPVNAYLGGPWNSGLVTVNLVVPDDGAWTGGARWFRCDVSVLDDLNDLAPTSTSATLKGALARSSAVKVSCVRWTDHKTYINEIKTSSCSSWFNGEYAGFFTAPDGAWPSTENKRDDIASNGCEGVVDRYIGFANSADGNPDVGIVNFNFDEDRWNAGDRTIRCFAAAYTKDSRFTHSVKGIRGNKPKG